MVATRSKLISCVGYAVRVAQQLDVPEEIHVLLTSALCSLWREAGLTSKAVPASRPIKLDELLFPRHDVCGHASASDEPGAVAGMSCGEVTGPDDQGQNTDRQAQLRETELVSQADVSVPVTSGTQVELDHGLRPSFKEDPEGFVRHFVAQATDDTEVVTWLQYLLTTFRSEHQQLPRESAQKAWIV